MRRCLLILLVAASAIAQEIAVSDPTFEEPTFPAAMAVTGNADRFITVWGYGDIDTPSVNGGVFASVTDLSGRLIRGPVTISLTGGDPAIASGTNENLVAWLAGRNTYVATIDNNGDVGAPTELISDPTRYRPISVVASGDRFLILLQNGLKTIGFLADQNGQVIAGPLAISDWTATATPDDDGFLIFANVAADPSHPEKGFTIQAQRINSTGAVSDRTPTTTVPTTFPNIAAAGRVLFWDVGGILHRVTTDANGAPLSDAISATGTLDLQKAISTASGTLLQFSSFTSQRSLMLVDAQGGVIATQAVAFGFDVASIGTTALLVTSGPLRAYPTNVKGTIQIGDAIGLGRIATAQAFTQVASNGKLLLATWYEPSSAQVFARIDPVSRKHLDGRGILIESQAYPTEAAVAPLGDGWLVAYLEVSSGVAHLWIRRVFGDGTLDVARTLVSTTAQPYPPRLASDGNQALLVWTENTYKVRGTRISRDGAILDPAFLQISDGDTLPLQFAPDVTIDRDNYLVAWQGQRTAPIQIHLSTVEVMRSGAVLDPPASMNMILPYRVAGNVIAGATASDVVVQPLGEAPIDLGVRSFGDIEKFGGGFLVAGPDPLGLWAAQIAGDAVENRFTVPLPAAAIQVSLAEMPTGVAAAYIRPAGDEGYGGAKRAYVLPISEQRRRAAPPAH